VTRGEDIQLLLFDDLHCSGSRHCHGRMGSQGLSMQMHANMAASRQRGVSMIELLIVVAIIGIATTMAIPVYQIYTIRAQVAQGLVLSAPHKLALTTYNNANGAFPADNFAAKLAAPDAYAGKYVESISVAGAIVSIRYGNQANPQINGRIVTLTASNLSGSVKWTCTSGGAIVDDHMPPACR
jgi:type IV pilus assembly protein PilA